LGTHEKPLKMAGGVGWAERNLQDYKEGYLSGDVKQCEYDTRWTFVSIWLGNFGAWDGQLCLRHGFRFRQNIAKFVPRGQMHLHWKFTSHSGFVSGED
jgi:hypothetical protein